MRGQSWPRGSSGPPHSGHGGRPASTSRVIAMASAPAHSALRRELDLVVALARLDRHDQARRRPRRRLDGHVAGDEVGLVLGLEGEVVGQVAGAPEFGQGDAEPAGQSGELELLALDDDEPAALAGLEEEEALADRAAGADHDAVEGVEDAPHEGPSSASEPVELTHSTSGAAPVSTMALTERWRRTVRWKRSSGTPIA